MRKKLGYLFLTICVALIVVYLFRYKGTLEIEGKIPGNATEVVHIDLRQIEHHLLVDALKNPTKYISFERRKKDKVSLRRAISIPRNLLFFTNKSTFKNAWFSSFVDLKKSAKFKRYLAQEGFQKVTNDTIEVFGKGRIVVGISNEKSIVAFKKFQNESVVNELQYLFQETNFYEKGDDILKLISNSESDVSYVSTAADFLEVNFENGSLEIKGKVVSELFKNDSYTENLENSLGFISTQINKEHPYFESLVTESVKRKFDDLTKLALDSILNKWNGGLVMNLKSVDKKSDTIVTYEYDDDFNKIEKQSIQEINIPAISITLGDEKGMFNYLSETSAIKTVDGDTLFTSIPLYKMFAHKENDALHIFTQNQLDRDTKKAAMYKLKGYLDLQKYLETPLEFSSVPAKKSYLHSIKSAYAEIATNDEFLMKILLKESDRNFLGKLVKP